jgi:hypothetical protein
MNIEDEGVFIGIESTDGGIRSKHGGYLCFCLPQNIRYYMCICIAVDCDCLFVYVENVRL